MSRTKESAYMRYTQTYSGRELLKKHSLTDTGLWRIRGEDPNCDFGGYHHSPDLGTVEGTLLDVIEYAIELKNFWTWGGGGDIELVKVQKIDEHRNRRVAELRKEAKELKSRLAEIETALNDLEEK
jgi:hypothetical protein